MSFGSSPFEKFSSGYGLGHNGVMVSLNYFEGLPVLQNISSTELQLCFKSLTKRDVKTKEKALSDLIGFIPVSYTHLDVYKRQVLYMRIM